MESTPIAPEQAPPERASRGPALRTFLRKRGPWLVGALLIAGGVALGVGWGFGTAKVGYVTATVERGDLESTVVAAGILQPVRYVDVGAQTSGKLKSLKVARGDQVVENQLLAEIDPVLAETALTSANATLANMTSQRSVKEAQLVLATAQRDRNEALFDGLLLSRNDRDVTRANHSVALAEVASLSAQMRQATAAVDTGKANLGYTNITAPMAGEVVSISLLEGQTLNANQQAPNILRIADMGTVTVWAQVSEADIVRVRVGQSVHFTVLGQARTWNGTIRQILPTPELINNVVFYDALFDIPNPDRELKIQMTAQVFIVLAQAKGVLLVPAAAIGNANEGATVNVQVLSEDGDAQKRVIQIGIKNEIFAEVKSGLKEKDRVVIKVLAEKGKPKSALTARKGP